MSIIMMYLRKSVLVNTIIQLVIILLISFLLDFFGLAFREWVYIFFAILFTIEFVIGIIQLIIKTKSARKKRFLMILSTIVVSIGIIGEILLGSFLYMPEHVIVKEQQKYVVYVTGMMSTHAHYYEYHNMFISGNVKRIDEDYGSGSFDPFKSKEQFDVVSTTYYNELGQFERMIEND